MMSSEKKFFLWVFFFLSAILFPSIQKIDQIINAISQQTGLPRPQGIRVALKTSAELDAIFIEDFRIRHPSSLLQSEVRRLYLVGLIKNEINLEEQLTKIIKGNIKAHYQIKQNLLLLDQSIPFEDEYSLGPLVVAVRMALAYTLNPRGPYCGCFFCDANWLDYALINGDATFVKHHFYGDDEAMISGMDGMSLIAQDPMVSAANHFEVEPIIKLFYTQGLIQGVNAAQGAFIKKKMKGLNDRLKNPPKILKSFLFEKPEKIITVYRTPNISPIPGFSRLSSTQLGVFLVAAFLDKSPQSVMNEMGNCGDVCVLDKTEKEGVELVQWKMSWKDNKTSRDAFLIIRDRYESGLGCRFEEGIRGGKAFLASRDQVGAYVFLRQDGLETLLARSFNRFAINQYIESIQY